MVKQDSAVRVDQMGESPGVKQAAPVKIEPEQMGKLLGRTKREQKKIAVIWKLMEMFKIENVFETLEEDRQRRKIARSKKVTANNNRMWAARRRIWEASLERDADRREQTPGARTIGGYPVRSLEMIRARGLAANAKRWGREGLK